MCRFIQNGRVSALLFPLVCLLTILNSGCESVDSTPSQGAPSTATLKTATTSQDAPQTAPEEVTEPIITWGADGVPVINEAAVQTAEAEKAEQETKIQEATEEKTVNKKKSRGKKQELPSYVEDDRLENLHTNKWQFTVQTNLQNLSEAPKKTRLQDFYEFNARVNKKPVFQLPDTAVDPVDNQPLFEQNELVATNAPMRLTSAYETKIRLVNNDLQFVVLDYTFAPVPPVETRLAVFRKGVQVGTVKVTGPTINSTTVAIIIDGAPALGDTVVRIH